MLCFMETTLNREEAFQGHRPCSAHGSTHQFAEGLLWHVLDGFPHVTQWMDGGAIAAGQVVPCHRDEVVLATLQVQHKDIFDLLLARVEIRCCWAVHKNLKLNLHRTT